MSVRTDVVNLNVNINGDKGKDELNQLRKRSADLTAEMRNLKKGTQEYITAAKELKQVNDRMDSLRAQIGLTALSQKELTAELKRLNALKNITTPQTEEFRKLQAQIDAVSGRLKEVKTGMFGFKQTLAGIKDEVKQFGVLAASYLGFEFLTSQVQNVIGAQKKLADENSNISKTTSITTEDIGKLNKEFKELDTRTSNSKLRQFAEEAGKLGKDGYEDVKRFAEEANMIDVALGADLGEDAIEKIAKLSGIFGQSMIQIASGINSVGQASAASESYQVDFAFRVAGTAKAAKLAAGDLFGFAAALEVNGQTSEVAATSLNTFFLDFIAKSNQFGKAAGFAKGELSKLINEKGVNEAFLQFLDRLKTGSTSTEDFIKKMSALGVDGARGANVMLVLANNLDEVRKQQLLANIEIEKGTSIVNEYNIKNNNFAATIDKLTKLINGFITSKSFVSFVTSAVNGLDKLLRSLPAVIDFVQRNALAFGLWTVAIVANTAAGARMLVWITQAVSWIGGLITGIKGLTIAQIANNIAFRAQLFFQSAAAAAMALFRGNIAAARAEYQYMTLALGANPFSALLIVLGAVLVACNQLGSSFGRLSAAERNTLEINKRVVDATADQVTTIGLLTSVINNHNVSLDGRKRALAELISINPEYLKGLTLENVATATGKKLIDDYILSLKKKAQEEATYALMVENLKKQAELEQKKAHLDKKFERYDKSGGTFLAIKDAIAAQFGSGFVAEYDQINEDLKDVAEERDDINKRLKKSTAETFNAGGGGGKLSEGLETDAERKKREAEEKKAARTAAAAEKKLESIQQKFNRLKAEAQRLSDDADAAEISKDEKQIQAVKDRYAKFLLKLDEQLKDKKGNLLVDAKEYAALVAGLSDAQRQELANLYKKQFDARSEKEYELALQNLSDYYDHQRQVTIQAYADGVLDRKAYKAKLKQLDADEETDSATVDADYSGTSKKAAKSVEGRRTKAAKKGADTRDADADAAGKDKIYAAERALLIAKKGTDAELAAKRALMQAKFDADTEYLDKSGEAYRTAQVQLNKDLKDADKQYLQEKIAQVGEVLQGITSLFSSYVDVQNGKEDSQLAREKSANDAKKASYDQQLKKKLISQGQYDKAIATLDAEMDARQKEIAARQAKRNKASALFSAIINAAMGITKIWATYAEAPYIAAALTAIEVAATAIQIDKIESQDVPKGRKGLVVQGSSHEQGGIDMIDRGTGRPVANIEGGEPVMVLSKNTYGNNRDVIDQLIYNSQQRNGARISAPWWDEQPAPVNTSRIIPLLRSGGFVSDTASAGRSAAAGSTDLSETNALMQQLIAKQDATISAITDQNNKLRAYVVLQDVTDSQDLLKKAKSVAGISQAA